MPADADLPEAARSDARPDARPEMTDAPPFGTWPRIYLVVVGALAVQVILYAALTAAFR